jgi:hypothetical protein
MDYNTPQVTPQVEQLVITNHQIRQSNIYFKGYFEKHVV